MSYILYHTLGCHLCELAEEQIEIHNQVSEQVISYTKVDIADDEKLVELYGIRIPVLAAKGLEETLDWPFDVHSLSGFIAKSTV